MRLFKIDIMVCLAMLVVALSFSVVSFAASTETETADYAEVQVYFNQKPVDFLTAPFIVEGRVVIPVRSFLEAMGSEVQWNEETRQVIALYKETIITLHLEDSFAEINGNLIEMNPSATVVHGSTMVPLRFLTECLGLTLDWNEEERIASITSKYFVPYKRVFPGISELLPDDVEDWVEKRREELGVDVNVFDNHLYIMAAFGLKESGGYDVQILNVERQQQNSFLVEIEYIEPAAGQYTFPAFTRPYDLVVIDLEHHDWPSGVKFVYKGDQVELSRHLPDQFML